jgi:Immunoglobulin I-set domain
LADELTLSDPSDALVGEGEPARFEVKVTGASSPQFKWTKNGGDLEEDSDTLEIASVSVSDIGFYRAEVTDGDKSTSSRSALLAVRPRAGPIVWNTDFAVAAALVIAAVGTVILIPLLWLAFRVTHKGNLATGFPALLAVDLVAAGVVLTAVVAYAGLLEFRGKARSTKPAKPGTKPAEADSEAKTIAPIPIGDVAKQVPAFIRAFGQLQSIPALTLVALALFGAGTALAWHAPAPAKGKSSSAGTATTTVTTTTTVTSTTTVTTTKTVSNAANTRPSKTTMDG